MTKTKKIDVLSHPVKLFHHRDEDFISLADIARHRDAPERPVEKTKYHCNTPDETSSCRPRHPKI